MTDIEYEKAGITLEEEDQINAFEFLRLLDHLYHDQLVATEEEIRARIPQDLPKIMELEEWAHPDVITGTLPGSHETFIQIAKVLETGDLSHYSPTLKVNTHWSNWPDGGTL